MTLNNRCEGHCISQYGTYKYLTIQFEGAGHIGVILHASPKHIEIAQQNCTMTWKGIKPTQMSRLIVPITNLTHYEAAEHGKYFFYKLRNPGQIAYFQPLVMPDGKRPSCPTAKAKQAAEIS